MKKFGIGLFVAGSLATLALGALGHHSIPPDAQAAHKLADSVLYPELVAALNDFAANHGSINAPDHLATLNAGDRERFQQVKRSAEQYLKAMDQAGF